MRKISIGIIGFGNIGKKRFDALNKLKDLAEVKIICEKNKINKKFKKTKIVHDLKELNNYDLDLSNRELYTNLIGAVPVEGTANSPLVESDMPVFIGFGDDFAPPLINVFIEVYDEDPTANYSVTWTQGNASATYNLVFTGALPNPLFHQPPIGLNGFYVPPLTFDLQTEGINYYEGDGGQANANTALPINFSPGSTNNTPLKITITKTESPLYSGIVI